MMLTYISAAYRTPKWIKLWVNVVAKNEKEGGPVFRFFMDLSDAGMNFYL